MTLIICESLREIGGVACATSAWSSRGQTLNFLMSTNTILDDIPTYSVLDFPRQILQSKENKRVGNLQRVRHLGSFR